MSTDYKPMKSPKERERKGEREDGGVERGNLYTKE
jgi:hypothetical protein